MRVYKCAQRLVVRISERQIGWSSSSGEDRWCGMNDAEDVDKRIQVVGERPKEARDVVKRQSLKMLEQKRRLNG